MTEKEITKEILGKKEGKTKKRKAPYKKEYEKKNPKVQNENNEMVKKSQPVK